MFTFVFALVVFIVTFIIPSTPRDDNEEINETVSQSFKVVNSSVNNKCMTLIDHVESHMHNMHQENSKLKNIVGDLIAKIESLESDVSNQEMQISSLNLNKAIEYREIIEHIVAEHVNNECSKIHASVMGTMCQFTNKLQTTIAQDFTDALSAINTDVARNNADINNLIAVSQDIDSTIATYGNTINDTIAYAKNIADNVDDLANKVDTVETSVAEIIKGNIAIVSQIDEVKKSISNTMQYIKNKNDWYDVDDIETRLADVEHKASNLSEIQEFAQGDLEDCKKYINIIDTILDSPLDTSGLVTKDELKEMGTAISTDVANCIKHSNIRSDMLGMRIEDAVKNVSELIAQLNTKSHDELTAFKEELMSYVCENFNTNLNFVISPPVSMYNYA